MIKRSGSPSPATSYAIVASPERSVCMSKTITGNGGGRRPGGRRPEGGGGLARPGCPPCEKTHQPDDQHKRRGREGGERRRARAVRRPEDEPTSRTRSSLASLGPAR